MAFQLITFVSGNSYWDSVEIVKAYFLCWSITTPRARSIGFKYQSLSTALDTRL